MNPSAMQVLFKSLSSAMPVNVPFFLFPCFSPLRTFDDQWTFCVAAWRTFFHPQSLPSWPPTHRPHSRNEFSLLHLWHHGFNIGPNYARSLTPFFFTYPPPLFPLLFYPLELVNVVPLPAPPSPSIKVFYVHMATLDPFF